MKKLTIILTIATSLIAGIAVGSKIEKNQEEVKIIKEQVREDGDLIVDFSDGSWAICNEQNEEYIFQPAVMGDWDMEFENKEHLEMAIKMYLNNVNNKNNEI